MSDLIKQLITFMMYYSLKNNFIIKELIYWAFPNPAILEWVGSPPGLPLAGLHCLK